MATSREQSDRTKDERSTHGKGLSDPARIHLFLAAMAVEDRIGSVEVPTLEVGGYWDQEDMWGTQAEYAALKKHEHQVFLVLGPWNHGGWQRAARRLGSEFGRLNFGEPTGNEFRKRFEAPFFEKYLKDRTGFDLACAASFRTGVNQWERYDVWPPVAGFEPARLYLEPGKQLSFTLPQPHEDAVAAAYVSDPENPVPYRHRPIQSTYAKGSKWSTWLVEDQRFVTGRKDVASFTLPALDHDVTDHRRGCADLFAATTGSDADWIVKLIDVYPDNPASPQQANSPGTQIATECGLSTDGCGRDISRPLSPQLRAGCAAHSRRGQ